MRDAMIAGVTLNIFNNHCYRVRMANLAQTVNVLQAVVLTKGEKLILTPTYHVMEMYKVHQDAILIPLTIKSGEFISGNEKLPAVSASASKDKNGVTHISIVNIDNKKPQEISIDISGLSTKSITGRLLASGKVQDHNTFEQPEKIKPSAFNQFSQTGNIIKLKIPPCSVIVLELK
jgi:alpha-N-arabinofuranosidase